ncbi:MAG: aminopeptidase [Patescibacteria group bacterium]|nr:aminopeptidase [Patescibacteria group bacterium]
MRDDKTKILKKLTPDELAVGLNTVKVCMGVKPKEKVLVITDSGSIKPANIIFESAKTISKNVKLLQIKIPGYDGREPKIKLANIMSDTDVLFLVTTMSLSHTNARRNATKKGVRIASMPGITYEVFLRTMKMDYQEVEKLTKPLAAFLTRANKVRVSSAAGTNLIMSIENMEAEADTGIFTDIGAWGNLPAGESAMSPKEGTSEGIIVVDGCSYLDDVPLDKPIVLGVKNGFITKVSGGTAAKELERTFKKLGQKSRNIAELGVGTNKMAKLNSSILEVEKVFGTVHIGIGNNISYGGTCNVQFHSDGVILLPTLEVDGKTILKNNEFYV